MRSLSRLVALFAVSALFSCAHQQVIVSSISPNQVSARGGTKLTIVGVGFTDDTTVSLDGQDAKFQKVSAEEGRLTSPPLYVGSVDAVIVNDGKSTIMPHALEVLPLDLRFIESSAFSIAARDMITTVGAAFADFDGDGDRDVVVLANDGTLVFEENDGRGNYSVSLETVDPHFSGAETPSTAITAADFDADGDTDFFVSHQADHPGVFFINDGKAGFQRVELEVPDGEDLGPATAVAVVDIDGNGKLDLVLGSNTAGKSPIRVYLNQSAGSFISFAYDSTRSLPANDWAVSAIAFGDLDHDGVSDLLLATPGATDGTRLRILFSRAGKFAEQEPLSITSRVGAVEIADFDGDGANDIFVAGPGQDRILENDGSGHFFDATASLLPVDGAPGSAVRFVDLDRDRDRDLIIGNDGGETRLYLNDGKGRFLDRTPALPIKTDETIAIDVSDADGDGDQDVFVITRDSTSSRLYLSVEPLTHAP